MRDRGNLFDLSQHELNRYGKLMLVQITSICTSPEILPQIEEKFEFFRASIKRQKLEEKHLNRNNCLSLGAGRRLEECWLTPPQKKS